MDNPLAKIFGGKKEWRAMEARAEALPEEYRFVYGKIKEYVWKAGGIDGIDIFKGVLELFEEGAADGRRVLDLTGRDVAAFCDGLLRDGKTYADGWRSDLNRDIARRLG